MVEGITRRLKAEGYEPMMEVVGVDVMEEEREENLGGHSEKLAVAYSVPMTAPGVEIRVSKNLRTCGECHEWMKMVSKMLSRVIVMRDRLRFHRFDMGSCSCKDYCTLQLTVISCFRATLPPTIPLPPQIETSLFGLPVGGTLSGNSSAGAGSHSDPILLWLQKIRFAYDQYLSNPIGLPRELLLDLIGNCISLFCEESCYKDDERFLKVFIINADASKEFTEVFKQLEKYDICQDHALFYECLAMFHIMSRNLLQANEIYKKGIARKAKPLDSLTNSYIMFRKNVHRIALKNSPSVRAKIERADVQKEPK